MSREAMKLQKMTGNPLNFRKRRKTPSKLKKSFKNYQNGKDVEKPYY